MAKKKISSLGDLTPDPANANRGTERGAGLLDTSIERYGLGRSIVTDRDGVILAGNKTAEAAGQKGLDRVRVVETNGDELVVVRRMDLEHGTPQATGLALADNRVAEVSLDFDMDAVRDFAENGLEEEVLSFWMPDELEPLAIEPPEEFAAYGEDIETEHRCPSCGYQWSGSTQ